MRLDPGNFSLGHPANKKSEMGPGPEQIADSKGWRAAKAGGP